MMCRKLLLQSQLQMQVGKRRFYEVRGDDTWRSATITQLNPGGTGEPTLVYTESVEDDKAFEIDEGIWD